LNKDKNIHVQKQKQTSKQINERKRK